MYQIIKVNYGDYKYYNRKRGMRQHPLDKIPSSYNSADKTVRVVVNPKYFRETELPYYAYKAGWQSDCLKILDGYNPKAKTVKVFVDARDYFYKILDLRNLVYDSSNPIYQDNAHLLSFKNQNISFKNDLTEKFVEWLLEDLVVSEEFYETIVDFELAYYAQNRIETENIISKVITAYEKLKKYPLLV